ncbi:uncharacterized protein LOC101852079 [Aplysia californica]|uniref:Uncharacterized protein LOC101852079 n=1 Tax=Aplysia californica TaxID=6500 RepID=A0ABM1AFW9_APLCA|nr:uncharacterized protein LOC101852079 [Aplysia californica]XP_012946860.1 uncharacterized protein LOC101852079 [Aplysia californica]XP_012946863.1 uncharacterized protein LOC101852079 [Aplysia californica]
MKMNLPPDRQGHLSDLMSKSVGELKELLERQEKILSGRAFLKTLPDKGERCRKFAEHLRNLISQKTEAFRRTLPSQTDMDHVSGFKQMSDVVKINTEIFGSELVKDVTERKVGLSAVADSGVKETSVQDHMDIASSLQKISISQPGEKKVSETDVPQNVFERVVRKMERATPQEKFMPNRTLKSKADTKQTFRPHTVPNTNVVEESNVRPPEYKFKESKLISINESVKLIDEQRARNEKLIAEHAAQRLAAQLVPKMATYSGQGNMQYREPKLPEQGDSDDDEDEEETQNFQPDDDDDVDDNV